MSDSINPEHYKRLPAEAIEIIEAMIAGAPDNKAAYLHGQGAKYDLRLWKKGKSLEDYLIDWDKHIWYALRLKQHLIELIEQRKAADIKSLMDYPFVEPEPVIKQSLTTEPPDGWRWLEMGEVIRKGDLPCKDGLIYATEPIMLGMALQEHWKPMIRRNKFEVGEKVVWVADDTVWTVHQQKSEITSCQSYIVRSGNLGWFLTTANKLAPYIEEQS